jgi:hypothetical protein
VALPEPLAVMQVEQVKEAPTVAVWAAERAAHSSSELALAPSSELALAPGMLGHRMLVATVREQAAVRMVP